MTTTELAVMTQRVMQLHDDYVTSTGKAVPLAEARVAILPEVIDLLASEERDLEREAVLLVNRVYDAERSKRTNRMKRDLEYFLDAISDPDGGMFVEPMLDLAFPLGLDDGSDKALRWWTIDDLKTLVVTRYRVAAEVTNAAKALDDTVQAVINRMNAAGVSTFGAVAWRPEVIAA